jgi:hypothetical protein
MLIDFEKREPPAALRGQSASSTGTTPFADGIVHVLRVGLLKLLSTVSPDVMKRSDELVAALQRLGWGHRAEAMLEAASGAATVRPALVATSAEDAIEEDDVLGLSQLPASRLVDVLIANLRYIPPEPCSGVRSVAIAKQACLRMIDLGQMVRLCGGTRWTAERARLVAMLACDPCMALVDRKVASSLSPPVQSNGGVGALADGGAGAAGGGAGAADGGGSAGGSLVTVTTGSVPATSGQLISASGAPTADDVNMDAPDAEREVVITVQQAADVEVAAAAARVELQDRVLQYVMEVWMAPRRTREMCAVQRALRAHCCRTFTSARSSGSSS